MGIWEIALSGLVGGLAATLILIWFQHTAEKVKNRKYIMIAVTEWLDNIYLSLQMLSAQKELIYGQEQPTLSQQEYNSMSNGMRILLLSNKITTEVACAYGKGNMLQKIITLQDSMTNAARLLWNSKPETWANSHIEIMRKFNENIDPLRENIMNDFFNSLQEFSILRVLKMKIRLCCGCRR